MGMNRSLVKWHHGGAQKTVLFDNTQEFIEPISSINTIVYKMSVLLRVKIKYEVWSKIN